MLMRFDPFREMDSMMRSIGGQNRMLSVPLDAYRRGDEFRVEFDLPGVEPDSIDLTVERDVLTVTARRAPRFQEGDQILVSERPSGEVTRQLFLGKGLDADRIAASYDAGVLTVVLPVAEEAKPHRISITTGNGNGHQKAVTAETASS